MNAKDLMLIKRGWNSYVDALRDDLESNHPQISVVDFLFYDIGVFNRCENDGNILMAIEPWKNVHPLLKILPVKWEHEVPFGILYSPEPSPHVLSFIRAVAQVFELEM